MTSSRQVEVGQIPDGTQASRTSSKAARLPLLKDTFGLWICKTFSVRNLLKMIVVPFSMRDFVVRV